MPTLEHRHSGTDLMDPIDGLVGYVEVLDDRLNSYEETLERFLGEDTGRGELEADISGVTSGLERIFDNVMELDALVEDENMVTVAQRDGDTGVFNFSSAYRQAQFDNGLEEFRDLVTVCYFIRDDDSNFRIPSSPLDGEEYGAPTVAVKNAAYIVEAFELLDSQYDRVVEVEEKSGQQPEPPVSQLLGGEYDEKASNLYQNVT